MTQQEATKRWWGEADRDQIHLAAAEWFARLRDPDVRLEDTLAWQAWMSDDPRHAEAFARLEDVSSALQSVPRPGRPSGTEARRDAYDGSVPIRDWRERPRRPLLFAVAASALVVSVALVLLALSRGSLPGVEPAGRVFATAVGENRTVRLADGSKVTLGGNSRIEVALSDEARRIDLARGEAFFTVAKDASRPFKVRAGPATVVAVGTEFNVRRGKDRVVVDVVEGRVVVEPASGLVPVALLRTFRPKLVPVRVDAGEETTAGSAAVERAVAIPDIAAATSWQAGRLAFRLQPLRYALEDVNRYARKPIVIGDEEIGELKITGTVMGSNVGGWVRSLESALRIVAVEEPEKIVLRKRR